jgi:3-hydroxyacyl-[acyl-carrier-protein] dehydratase
MRFVLFDRVVELRKGSEAVFVKNIAQSEDYFTDHFPGYPVVPGSIILGSFEQGGEILLAASFDFSALPLLNRVSRASFKRFVLPGDQLRVCLTLDPSLPNRIGALAQVQGKAVGDATLDFSLTRPDGNPKIAQACERLRLLYDGLTSASGLSRAWELWERLSQSQGGSP